VRRGVVDRIAEYVLGTEMGMSRSGFGFYWIALGLVVKRSIQSDLQRSRRWIPLALDQYLRGPEKPPVKHELHGHFGEAENY
jgi:hypothetical protein